MKVPKVDKKTNIKIEIGVSLAVDCMIALFIQLLFGGTKHCRSGLWIEEGFQCHG